MKTLSYSDGGIALSISLQSIPSDAQFANASHTAQSIALCSVLSHTWVYQSLTHTIASISALSRNQRRILWTNRAILNAPTYPQFAFTGSIDECRTNLSEYIRTLQAHIAATTAATTQERKIAILNRLQKRSPHEVSLSDSQSEAKRTLSANKATAKKLYAQMLSIQLGEELFSASLLDYLKEMLRGDNLATASIDARRKICTALRVYKNESCCITLASLIESSADPFLSQKLSYDLDSLNLEPISKSTSPQAAPRAPRSLADRIAAKRAAQAAALQQANDLFDL